MGWDPMEPSLPGCGMTPWVGSFDPVKFIYFMLATVLLPYPCYIVVATIFNWEHRPKRPARHYQDILHATSYGLILFIFGNYTQTFNWKSWPKGMYILFLGALGVILAFAAYHIYLGYLLNRTVPGFLGYYLLGLLIPATLTLIGYACYKQQNLDKFGLSRFYNQLLFWKWKRAANVTKRKIEKQAKATAAAKAKAQLEQQQQPSTPPQKQELTTSSTTSLPPTPPPKPGSEQLSIANLDAQLNAAADAADAAVAAGASSVVVEVHDDAPLSPSNEDTLAMQSMSTVVPPQVHVLVNQNTPTTTIEGSSSVPTSHLAETTATPAPGSTVPAAVEATGGTAGVGGSQAAPPPQVESTPDHPELTVSIQPFVPYAWTASVPAYFHPHHWQMFYALAFFTRFDHWVSRVGGGIVIGCYMQGIMAYGFDYLLEE
ncbi:hypothetical protein DFQ27_005669 [Actinomortierella ambigua]|uniref:Uncharacterized protein n=1 Tax=Actinomortierella ambigua TaxID=1343610 RepID=A0A9P6Q1N0_9FUNG|nr:hypothetical protein DFQ27_005669 [Actinomortierella ambigua]